MPVLNKNGGLCEHQAPGSAPQITCTYVQNHPQWNNKESFLAPHHIFSSQNAQDPITLSSCHVNLCIAFICILYLRAWRQLQMDYIEK